MKNIWKNVLGVALIAAISSGAAIGTSTYLMNKNQRPVELASGVENTFKQPYRLTNYGTVAAENIDFTTAAESAIHGVVHIKATANAQASNGDGGQQYMDPFEYFFGFGGRGGSNVRNSNLVWAPARVSLSLRMVISSRTTT